MSEIKVNKVSPATGTAITLGDSGDTFTVPSGATIVNSGTATGFGGGKLLQVLQDVKADAQSISGNTFTTVLSQAITPSATSSKVLVQFSINVSGSVRYSAVNLYRDSTQIGMGDADGSMARVSVGSMANESASNGANVMFNSHFSFLDSPSSSSAVTYYVKAANTYTYTGNSYGPGSTTYINRMAGSGNSDWSHAGASTLTVTEIGA